MRAKTHGGFQVRDRLQWTFETRQRKTKAILEHARIRLQLDCFFMGWNSPVNLAGQFAGLTESIVAEPVPIIEGQGLLRVRHCLGAAGIKIVRVALNKHLRQRERPRAIGCREFWIDLNGPVKQAECLFDILFFADRRSSCPVGKGPGIEALRRSCQGQLPLTIG